MKMRFTGPLPVTTMLICFLCGRDAAGQSRFYRGDCNSSREPGGMAVDIADAPAVLSFLFLSGARAFHPPCLDACDANDSGKVDITDAIYLINFLFRFGPFPPPPGPGFAVQGSSIVTRPPGTDPTPDGLNCSSGL